MITFAPEIGARHAPTRRFAIGEREVLVFDDLFANKTLRVLYQQMRASHFHWGAYDSMTPPDRHAVRWRADIAAAAAKLPFFEDVIALVSQITTPRLVLDRIYVNFNVYGEVHHAHVDAPDGATALFCANLEWEPEWQGETVFYDGAEPSHVVAPRPGRLIVFDGSLRHRGSPPARDCFEPRINIAFKFLPRTSSHKRPSPAARVVRMA